MKRLWRLSHTIAAVSLCCTHPQPAQAQSESTDSITATTTLQEVVVKAPESHQSGNRQLFYPSHELKESMTTASRLMAALQIPGLIVDPSNGSISISGGGKLSILINGRPASQTDLMSISANDISRVEYIPNPGVRYADATGVLDITTKRRTAGYGIVLNLLQSPNRGWGDYTAGLKYNVGRSEWSADYHSNPMWHMDCYRNNMEHIALPQPDCKISRRELGLKTPNRMVTHRASVQYSYACGGTMLLNVQARLTRQNDRYASTGTITTSIDDIPVSENRETETAPFSSWQGDLDIYFHRKISPRHKVYINIVPTVVSSTSLRCYESGDLSLNSQIVNRAERFLAEGVWEGRISPGLLTAGLRWELRHDKAIYSSACDTIHNQSAESHAFFEWSHTIGKVRYIAGIDASFFNISRPVSGSFTNLSPRFFMRYTPTPRIGINLSVDGSAINPTYAQMSPVEQRIDLFQYSQGSTSLTPFRRLKASLETDFRIKDAVIKVSLTDIHSHRPIMSAKSYIGNKIVQTWCNAGAHNNLEIKCSLRTPLFTKRLTLSLEGGWHRMVSRGSGYRHTYSQGIVNAQLMYVAGPWWIMAKYNNACNLLWGETIESVNNNLLNFGVGYRYKAVTFMAGIVNPVGNVSISSRDLSLIAGYERTYHAASSNSLAWVGITFNLFKGSRRTATQKKLDNNKTYETIKNIQK